MAKDAFSNAPRAERSPFGFHFAARSDQDTMSDTSDNQAFRSAYEREKIARVQVEKLLSLKRLELQHAQSALRGIFSHMSHDLRTPLAGMLGIVDLLWSDESNTDRKALLADAKAAGLSLNQIVSDMLDFAALDAGDFALSQAPVDLRAVIESVRISAEARKEGADRSLICKIDKSVPARILGDAARLRQILSSLVDNALHYSKDGPILLRVNTVPDPEGALLQVDVEDFGGGISEVEIQHLFKDFAKAAPALTTDARSTGLNLALCKRIIEGLGGDLGIDTAQGSGSTFWFELPVVIAEPHAEGALAVASQDQPSLVRLAGKRILIAEDNIINQKLLLAYAKRMGMRAELAQNGQIAIEMFSPDRFDLVLMDVAMPELDGIEAARHLREGWAAEVLPPILLLTAHMMGSVEAEAKRAGVEAVLLKPIAFEALKSAFETALSAGPLSETPSVGQAGEAEVSAPEPQEATSLLDMMSPSAAKELLEMFSITDLKEFTKKYVADTSDRLEKILSAIQAGDGRVVAQQAHSLKGSSLVFGFQEIPEWAQYIEKSDPLQDRQAVLGKAHQIRKRLDELDALL